MKKGIKLFAAIMLIGLLFSILIKLADHHPAVKKGDDYLDQIDGNALFYTESSEAVSSSYLLKRRLKE